MVLTIIPLSVFAIETSTALTEDSTYGLVFVAKEDTTLEIIWNGTQIVVDHVKDMPLIAQFKALYVSTVGVIGDKWTVTFEQGDVFGLQNLVNGSCVIRFDDTKFEYEAVDDLESWVELYNENHVPYINPPDYQDWMPPYPDSIYRISDYPYQCIIEDQGDMYIYASTTPLYKIAERTFKPSGSGTGMFAVLSNDGITWNQSRSLGQIGYTTNGHFVQTNNDIYEDALMTIVFFGANTSNSYIGGGGNAGVIGGEYIPPDPNIPVVPPIADAPDRGDYEDGILGTIAYLGDTVLFWIKIPFILMGNTLSTLANSMTQTMQWTDGVVRFLTGIFAFLPQQVVSLITTCFVIVTLAFVLKLFRG